MSYQFKDKVIWLTGASKGIGYELAKSLQSEGARLVLSSRDTSQLNEFTSAILLDCDVTSKEQIQTTIETIEQVYGRLDCIILNAGDAEYVDVSQFSSETYRRMFEVNFFSQVNAIECCLPLLRKSSTPYIVAMTSSVAWTGLSRGHAYSASKAASRNFFQGLALDLANENIPVSIVCPGFIRTPLTDKNDFPMPFLMEPDAAANRILLGMQSQKHEIHFPRRFTWLLKLVSILPAGIRHNLLKRIV